MNAVVKVPSQTHEEFTQPSKSGSEQPEDVVHDSYVRRERLKKQATQKIVESMRHALPKYSLEEIREFRLPYHEALTINLEEAGFISTAAYINELIAYQDDMRRDAPPGSNIATKPQLKLSKEEIILLSERLKVSEIFHTQEKIEEECEEFLKIAVHFAFLHADWWWLGEQLLIQIIKVSSSYTALGGKYEALSRYAYARFLFEKVKEYDKAAEQLLITAPVCEGKGWTSINYFPEVRGTLFMQTNHAIYDCLIRETKILIVSDPKKAIIIAKEAKHRAAQACHYNGEAIALVMKGLAEMAIMDTKTAVNSLLRAFNLQYNMGTVEGMCKVRIHLAKAYLLDNCGNASLRVLMDLKQDAENNDLPYFLGEAYRHLGDYYLSNAQPELANPLLKETLKIFKELNVDSEKIANVRNLEAISAGLQLFPKYIEVLNDAGTENNRKFNNVIKIVHWKDQRTEFWDEKDVVNKMIDIASIIKKSMMMVQGSRAEILDEKFRQLSSIIADRKMKVKEEAKFQAELKMIREKGDSDKDEEKEKKRKVKLPESELPEVSSTDQFVEFLAPRKDEADIQQSQMQMETIIDEDTSE